MNLIKFSLFAFLITFCSCSISIDDIGVDDLINDVFIINSSFEGTKVPIYVAHNGADVSDEFTELKIVLDDSFNFTSNASEIDRQPNPWADSGHFALLDTAITLNTSSFALKRNDGVEMLAEVDDETITLSFDLQVPATQSTFIDERLNGAWIFVFNKE